MYINGVDGPKFIFLSIMYTQCLYIYYNSVDSIILDNAVLISDKTHGLIKEL